MANPKVTVEVTESGFEVNLENWDGVTNVMIERIHYAIVRKSQVFKAQKVGATYVKRMADEAAARQVEANKHGGVATKTFSEELENVIASS
jgi:hypothetical protein